MRCTPPRLPVLLAALVALSLGAGCLPGSLNLPGVGGDEYGRQLDRWTRKVEVYRRFEAKTFVTATYLAPAFRDAYIRKRTAILGLPKAEQARLREQEDRRAEAFHEFFVAVYTGSRHWNDLDKKGTSWRVTLQNDRNERVVPVEIVRVDSRNAEMSAYFPYLDAFRQGYLVRFPKVSLELNAPIVDPAVHQIQLLLSSPVAVAELSWSLNGS